MSEQVKKRVISNENVIKRGKKIIAFLRPSRDGADDSQLTIQPSTFWEIDSDKTAEKRRDDPNAQAVFAQTSRKCVWLRLGQRSSMRIHPDSWDDFKDAVNSYEP